MATTSFFFLLTLLFIPANSNLQSNEEGFISALVSYKGLDFVKDLLVNKALSTLTPLGVPPIKKFVKAPGLGEARFVFSNIKVYEIDVSSSYVKPGEIGVTIVASGATANISMNWFYSCSTWLLPIAITDQGGASVQVEGMEVGLTLRLENQEGTLRLSLLDCGCYVKDISIKLDGGASWLYQGVVDAFGEQIESSVEEAVSKKIREGIVKLDSLLQNIPKEIPMNNVAIFNATFVNDLVLSNSSLGFEINGLLKATDKVSLSSHNSSQSQPFVSCGSPTKMIGISIHEDVINSASVAYFSANLMNWVVDKVPDQSLLNTAGWRFVIPQLFRQYPNDDMNLNFSASSPPTAKFSDHDIYAAVYLDMTINVLDAGGVIPVACLSMVIDGSGSAEISSNSLAGSVRLDAFSLALKWSRIGNLHMHLVQSLVSTILRTVFLPYVNLRLRRGFPLPTVDGFTLEGADLFFTHSRITICSDIAFTGQ